MRVFLALLLCVGLGAPVAACEEPVATPTIEVVASTAVEVVTASLDATIPEVMGMGQRGAMANFALSQNQELYADLGATEEELARLTEISGELRAGLERAGPEVGKGMATIQYGLMLTNTAEGSLSQQFEGTALICKGLGVVEGVRTVLERCNELVDEAGAIIERLIDPPEESDPEA
jgi:hypothetical protein